MTAHSPPKGMLKFSPTCNKIGCSNPSVYCPSLTLYTLLDEQGFETWLGLSLCEEHKHITAKDVISDEGWNHLSNITKVLFKTPPLRDLTKVRAVRIPPEDIQND